MATTLVLSYLRNVTVPRAAPPDPGAVDIGFAPRQVARALATAIAVLICLGIGVATLEVAFARDHIFGLAGLANLNGERNLPAWFSSAQLLTAGGLSLMVALMGPRREARRWQLLGVIFVLLSLDEAASLHEQFNSPLRAVVGDVPALYFPWVALGAALALVVAAVELPLLAALPRGTRRCIVAAGACFVGGAVGLEILAAPLYAAGATSSALHASLVIAEESLEMAGIALFIVTLLRYAAAGRLSLTVIFDDRAGIRYGRRARVRMSPRRVTNHLVRITLGLAAISLASQAYLYYGGMPGAAPLVRLVNLTREGNIPTWWQTSALLGCAAGAFVIAMAQFRSGAPFRRHWAAVALAFTYMSLDEGAGIHELTVRPLRETFGTTGLLYYPWVVLGAAVAAAAAIVSRRFLAALPQRTRRLLIAAAGVFLSGALGVEAVGGMYAELHDRASMGYAVLTTVEETLEMLGVVIAARALMEFIRDHVGLVRIGREEQVAAVL